MPTIEPEFVRRNNQWSVNDDFYLILENSPYRPLITINWVERTERWRITMTVNYGSADYSESLLADSPIPTKEMLGTLAFALEEGMNG
jgi:hypothetical protein